jgi:O-antigen/teichoic acid export membrane protein
VIATVINVAMTAALIPRFRENGAAAGFAASQLITSTLLFVYYYRFLPFGISPRMIAGVLVANVAMGAAVIAVRDINLVLAILLPGSVYAGMVVLLRTVTREDLTVIRGALSRRRKKAPEA